MVLFTTVNNEELLIQNKASLPHNEEESCEKQMEKTGSVRWKPELNEEVLLKCQPNSDAALGITINFMRLFDGPWLITYIFAPSRYETSGNEGKIRGTLIGQPGGTSS